MTEAATTPEEAACGAAGFAAAGPFAATTAGSGLTTDRGFTAGSGSLGSVRRKTQDASTRLPVLTSVAQTMARWYLALRLEMASWMVSVTSPLRASYV